MICPACAYQADRGLFGEELHKKAGCKGGTHCDCMHREGPQDRWIQPQFSDQKAASKSDPKG